MAKSCSISRGVVKPWSRASETGRLVRLLSNTASALLAACTEDDLKLMSSLVSEGVNEGMVLRPLF